MSASPNSPSRNQRRLALRNANLRPPLIQRNATPRADQPSSSILLAINNGSQRRRQRRPTNDAFTIFQDATSGTWRSSSLTEPSNDQENQLSPEASRRFTPTPVPPITSHLTVPRVRSSPSAKVRNSSNEYRMHIEHLEAQLVAAQGQIEDFASPKTKKTNSVKRRALSRECELLRLELSDVEERCQRRIDEEAEEHQASIRKLERELEISEQKRMDAEYDLEETKKTLKSVQASHCELERRLDSLSGLLARSPTKVDMPTPSPMRPRPKSMLPRMPTRSNFDDISPSKQLAPTPIQSPVKDPSPSIDEVLQRPMSPRKEPAATMTPRSPIRNPIPFNRGSISIQKRRQVRQDALKLEDPDKETPDKCLSDELGALGLQDIFTKHSQTASSPAISTSSVLYGNSSPAGDTESPGSPLSYKSERPQSRPPRVMRRFVNTADGPKPLVLSAALRPDRQLEEKPEPKLNLKIKGNGLACVFRRLSDGVWGIACSPFVAARWCIAMFLLGPLAWRRALAGPTMIYGS
ncbi:MAG: hypothetical protein M1820_005248 [Bogoriella megaspora]|nr:MAG: hypothetical protein M1820_005248 [Bogoriella megaspora]